MAKARAAFPASGRVPPWCHLLDIKALLRKSNCLGRQRLSSFSVVAAKTSWLDLPRDGRWLWAG